MANRTPRSRTRRRTRASRPLASSTAPLSSALEAAVDVAVAVADDTEAEEVVRSMVGRGYRLTTLIEHTHAGRLSTDRAPRVRAPSRPPRDLARYPDQAIALDQRGDPRAQRRIAGRIGHLGALLRHVDRSAGGRSTRSERSSRMLSGSPFLTMHSAGVLIALGHVVPSVPTVTVAGCATAVV